MDRIFTVKQLAELVPLSQSRIYALIRGTDKSQKRLAIPNLPARRLSSDKKGGVILISWKEFEEWFRSLPYAFDSEEEILEELNDEK